MNNQGWKTLSSKTVYTSPWLSLRLDEVQLPNGSVVADYSIIELPHVATIVAVTKENSVILVKQYRHAQKQFLTELPAGTYNPAKETALAAATRELQEETGYRAASMIELGKIVEYPTKQTHTVTLFLATDLTHATPIHENQDETEDIEVIAVPFEEAITMTLDGRICVGGSVAALLLAREHLLTSR